MRTPAIRADETVVDFVCDGVELPAIRLTAKMLDESSFLAACCVNRHPVPATHSLLPSLAA